MIGFDEVINAIESFAPIDEYVDIDSSGVQVRTGNGVIERIIVCLEINDDVIDEAIETGADMIVTHHPLIFYPVSSIENNDVPGRYIIRLVENGISVYSSHLPFDFCETGNNVYLAELMGLEEANTSSGRFKKPVSLNEACGIVESALDLPGGCIGVVDGGKTRLSKVGYCTGAGGDMIRDAIADGCDLFITGDLKLHEAQYAKAMGISVIDAGHFGTEKIFTENFARQLAGKLEGKAEVIEAEADVNPYTI